MERLDSMKKKSNKKIKENLFKNVVISMKNSVIDFFKNLRKDPKGTLIALLNGIVEGVKNNSLFFVYIILNVIIGILLRYFTIHTIDNLLLLKPILGDLAIVVLLGSFNFALKEKHRFAYLLVVSIIFTILCVANSIYYTL